MSETIKILFLSASPGSVRPDRELRDIEERIRRATHRSSFEVASAWAVRPSDITEALLRHRPTIVHFSGHGSAKDGIYLEDDRGRPVPVSATTMCRLFEALRGTIRIVIFNACETRPIAEALRGVVDYAISMRRPVTDHAAIAFSSAFYSALAHGQSVRGAFDLALAQLDLDQIPETDIPDLLERSGGSTVEVLVPPPAAAPPPVVVEPPVSNSPMNIGQQLNFQGATVGTLNNNATTVFKKG